MAALVNNVSQFVRMHRIGVILLAAGIIATALLVVFFLKGRTIDLSKSSTWLLTGNFTIAFFAINFAFIGYNLSPYAKLWRRLSSIHWFVFGMIMVLPLFPAISMLWWPDSLWYSALLISPILGYFAVHSYLLTEEFLDPLRVLEADYGRSTVEKYCVRLVEAVRADEKRQSENRLVPIREGPLHMVSPRTLVLETPNAGLWDRLMTVTSVSVDLHDFAVFSRAFDKAIAIFRQLYLATGDSSESLQLVARRRIEAIVQIVERSPSAAIFAEAVHCRLCFELTECVRRGDFRTPLAAAWAGFIEDACQEALVNKKPYDPIKGMNAIYSVVSAGSKQVRDGLGGALDDSLLASYASIIKRFGQYAIKGDNVEFLYRCFESLSWLGCEMAKAQREEPLKACIAGLVQLAREARYKRLKCFWSACLIPPHLHAEEHLGHILTWLVQYKTATGFFLDGTIAGAYSRIRGFECGISADSASNPVSWVKEDKAKPHRIHEMGRHGYYGVIDYSDEGELKEYDLH